MNEVVSPGLSILLLEAEHMSCVGVGGLSYSPKVGGETTRHSVLVKHTLCSWDKQARLLEFIDDTVG